MGALCSTQTLLEKLTALPQSVSMAYSCDKGRIRGRRKKRSRALKESVTERGDNGE